MIVYIVRDPYTKGIVGLFESSESAYKCSRDYSDDEGYDQYCIVSRHDVEMEDEKGGQNDN